jgi:hypothetical protein
MTKICENANPAASGVQQQADRILGVMWDGESFDDNIAQFELCSGAEEAAVKARCELALQSVSGVAIAIDRDVELLRQQGEALDMIGMFVSDYDTGEIFRCPADACQAFANLAPTQPRIDQNSGFLCFHIRAISCRTASENRQSHRHGQPYEREPMAATIFRLLPPEKLGNVTRQLKTCFAGMGRLPYLSVKGFVSISDITTEPYEKNLCSSG